MKCPKCNADLKEGAQFCHVCGYKLESPKQDSPYPEPPKDEKLATDEKIDTKTFTDVKSDEVIASVKSGNLFKRIFAILFNPAKEWGKVSAEKAKVPMIIFAYLLILGFVAFIAVFLGDILSSLRYSSFSGGSFVSFMIFDVIKLAVLIATPVVAALIINAIAPAFKVGKDFGKMLQLTAYSFTPVYIAWTLYLIPSSFMFHLVQVVSLYGALLMLIGYKKVLTIPANKQVGMFFTMAGILYGVYYVLYLTVYLIQTPFYGSWYGSISPF